MKKLCILTSIFIISIGFSACRSRNYVPLSEKEKKFVSYLAKEYQAKVILSHDKSAIKNSGSSGSLYIELKNSEPNLCAYEDDPLKNIVLKIGSEIEPIIDHREYYQFVEVFFSEYKEISPNSNWGKCMKTFKMKFGNKNIDNIEKTSSFESDK